MASLLDLSYDLINKAKLVQNSQQKLFNLEQVKEIIFYRDKTLIPQVIPELFELMLERSVAIRKFLVKVAGDALRHSISLTSSVLPLFSFLIVDGNDKVLQSIAFEFANCYDKMSIYVATIPTKPIDLSGKQESGHDSRDLWHQLRSMTNVLVETIASNRSDSLRIQSIKLCENVVLFGLPPSNAPTIKDPRMAKFSGGRTLVDIPSNHQFIDRNDVEKEADGILSKLVLWARRGGPQGFPFSQTALSQLGQTIGVVAAERLSVFRKTIPALLFLIQGKDSISPVYNNPVARQQLSFLLARIIKAATGQPDPDGLLKKLQETLSALDKLNPVSASTLGVVTARDLSSLDPRKRKLEEKAIAAALLAAQTEAASKEQKEGEDNAAGEDEDYRDEEDGDLAIDEDSIRASALAALDAAESQIQAHASKRIRLEDLVPVGESVVPAPAVAVPEAPRPPTVPTPTFVPPPTIVNEYSTLASDIGAFPSDASTSMRLVSITNASGSDKSTTSMFQSVGPPCEVFSDLAMGSLSKILHNTLEPSTPSRLRSLLHLQLLLRTTFAMAQKDNILSASAGISNANSNSLSISILKSRVAPNQFFPDSKLKQQIVIPMEVNLPRSIWLYISHCLQGHEGESNGSSSFTVGTIQSIHESNLTNDLKRRFDRLDLILALIREVYACSQAFEEGKILGIPSSYVPLRYEEELQDGGKSKGVEREGDENVDMNVVQPNDLSLDDEDMDSPPCPLYDSICLVMLTRLIQRRILRPSSMRILLSLPTIPLVCLRLLGLLLVSGTKQIATSGAAGRRKGPVGNDRGTRIAALDIMGSLLLHEPCMTDPNSFISVLFPILWLTTSEDFSTRSAAVNVLVRSFSPPLSPHSSSHSSSLSAISRIDRESEEGHPLSHVKTTILLFAQQLALNVVGVDCFAERAKLRNLDCEKYDDVLSTPNDVMRFLCDLDFESNVTLVMALRSHDNGRLFGQSFETLTTAPHMESYAKRYLHLLVQLTLSRPHLLISFLDLYATITVVESTQIQQQQTPLVDADSSADATAVAPTSTQSPFEEQVALLPRNSGQSIRRIIRNEVLNIIPAITTSSKATDSVFDTLLQSEPLALPLLISVLDIILDDPQIPPSEHMVSMVTLYYDKLPAENQDIRLLIPILGGMTKEKVAEILPILILKLQDDKAEGTNSSSCSTASGEQGAGAGGGSKGKGKTKYDYLQQCFIRITQARPPPLSRSHLLVLLHRINYEAYKIPLKLLVETISLCLASKEEFNSDVIKDALNILLEDRTEPLPIVIMRTVILSSQSLPEVKKFSLATVIPTLIQRKIWITAPTIWDGIAHAVKAMIGSRDSDLTIKSLLSLPLTQLRSVLKVATNVHGHMAKVLKGLSPEDSSDVLTGKYAHLEQENHEAQREEKRKLFEDILSSRN